MRRHSPSLPLRVDYIQLMSMWCNSNTPRLGRGEAVQLGHIQFGGKHKEVMSFMWERYPCSPISAYGV